MFIGQAVTEEPGMGPVIVRGELLSSIQKFDLMLNIKGYTVTQHSFHMVMKLGGFFLYIIKI